MSSQKQVFSSHAGVQKIIFHNILSVFKESTLLFYQECGFALSKETVLCVKMFRNSNVLDIKEMIYFQTCF